MCSYIMSQIAVQVYSSFCNRVGGKGSLLIFTFSQILKNEVVFYASFLFSDM